MTITYKVRKIEVDKENKNIHMTLYNKEAATFCAEIQLLIPFEHGKNTIIGDTFELSYVER